MLYSLSKQKEKEFQLVLYWTVGLIKYIWSMLTLFSTIKAYYLFSSDVVNTEIINIKEIANLSKLIMFIMSFRFLEMIYMYALLLKKSFLFFIS